MRGFLPKLAVTTAVCVLSACTTNLASNRGGTDKILIGQAYNLPKAELFVTIERELQQCEAIPRASSVIGIWLARHAEPAEQFASRVLTRLDDAATEGGSEWKPLSVEGRAKIAEALDVSAVELAALQIFKSKEEDPEKQKQELGWLLLRDRAPKDPFFADDPAAAGQLLTIMSAEIGPRFDYDTWEAALGEKTPTAELDYRFVVAMRSKVTRELLPDPDHYYALDYSTMGNGWKKTEYLVEKYPNGTLKSINSVLDDLSGAAVGSIASGLINVALAASGAGPISAVAAAVPEAGEITFSMQRFAEFKKALVADVPLLCHPRVTQLLEAKKDAQGASTAAAAAAASQNSVIEALAKEATKAAAELEKQKAAKAALPATDTTGVAAADVEIAKAKKASEEATQKVDNAKKLKDGLQKAFTESGEVVRTYASSLTLTSVRHITPAAPGKSVPAAPGKVPEAYELSGAKSAASQWLTAEGMRRFCQDTASCKPDGDDPNLQIPNRLLAFAQLMGSAATSGTAAAPFKGVIYREPGRGIIKVCAQDHCLSEGAVQRNGGPVDILSETVEIPQFGVIALLPFENSSFQNNSVTASFTETGSVASVKYVSNARVVGMAKAFEETTDKYKDYRDARRDQPLKEVKAETELIEAQTKLSEAKKALADAEAARLKVSEPETTTDAP